MHVLASLKNNIIPKVKPTPYSEMAKTAHITSIFEKGEYDDDSQYVTVHIDGKCIRTYYHACQMAEAQAFVDGVKFSNPELVITHETRDPRTPVELD